MATGGGVCGVRRNKDEVTTAGGDGGTPFMLPSTDQVEFGGIVEQAQPETQANCHTCYCGGCILWPRCCFKRMSKRREACKTGK